MASCKENSDFIHFFKNTITNQMNISANSYFGSIWKSYRKPLVLFSIICILVVYTFGSLVDCGFHHSINGESSADIKYTTELVSDSEMISYEDRRALDSEIYYVHITGAVLNPGVYELHAGDRIQDALLLAKPDENADIHRLNLASLVSDGQKIIVPSFSYDNSSNPDNMEVSYQDSEKISINTADLDLLMELPGIGEVKGRAILEYRKKNGLFRSINELTNVDGIGPALFERIKNDIAV